MHAFDFVDYSFRAVVLARRPQLVAFCPIALIRWAPGAGKLFTVPMALPQYTEPFRVSSASNVPKMGRAAIRAIIGTVVRIDDVHERHHSPSRA